MTCGSVSRVISPLFVIIIPVHGEKLLYIEGCLRSILEQTYTHWQCTIVNTLPQNDISPIVPLDPRFRVLDYMDAPPGKARNYGLSSISRADYVMFQDADDILDSHALENAASNLETCFSPSFIAFGSSNKAELLGTARDDEFKHLCGEDMRKTVFPAYYGVPSQTSLNLNTLPGILWSFDVIQKNGLCFDESLFFGEDVLFCTRFYLVGESGLLLEQYIGHRVVEHSDSLTKTRKLDPDQFECMQLALCLSFELAPVSEQPFFRSAYPFVFLNLLFNIAQRFDFSFVETVHYLRHVRSNKPLMQFVFCDAARNPGLKKKIFFFLFRIKAISIIAFFFQLRLREISKSCRVSKGA